MPIAAVNTARRSFYEKVILSQLSRMEHGSLNMTMPSGEVIKLGNGEGITANMEIKNDGFFKRCVLFGDIGFGEAYVDGDWDTDSITNVIKWFILNIENAPTASGSNTQNITLNILKVFNWIYHFKRANSVDGSRKNISEHYDLNNDFFALFLDPTMTYSSAYFKEEGMDLKQAQFEK
ncbi:MAG TPA: class I SAM-dependent methyltransferase, partial [Bacteroidia bacterium]